MGKIKYMVKRIISMNYKNLYKTSKRISQKTGKNNFLILLDILYCGIRYMAGYVDYEVFEFYNLNSKQRKTYITRGINNKIVKKFNDKSYMYILDDKIEFDKIYKDFLKRDFLDLRETPFEKFETYIKNKKVAIAKPIDLSCGKGVEKIEYKKDTNLKNLYDSLKEHKQYLIEDYVMQHDDLNKLYPEAVNTLRIVTFLKKDKVNIIYRCIRLGNNGNVVDNFNKDGLFTTIDEDGVIRKPAVDKKGNIYENHPYTNTPIVGYRIPMFDKVIKFVEDIAKVTPEIAYSAWDICITPTGPVAIEGNSFPGHDVYQSKIHLDENKLGILPKFKKVMELD